mgnify:CR=1 FL=1
MLEDELPASLPGTWLCEGDAGRKKLIIENMKKLILGFKFSILTLTIIFHSCSRERPKRLGEQLMRYQEGFISGDVFIDKNDTVFNGRVNFFDLKKKMIAIVEYTENIKNGKIKRFSNGKIEQESSYFYDYENGMKVEYDSVGNVTQRYFVYFGRQVGPSTQYKEGHPFHFIFSNFDKKILYKCEINNGKKNGERGSLTNFTTDFIYENGKKKLALYFYVIEPPYKKIEYLIYLIDEKLKKGSLVYTVNSDDGFIQEILLDMPKSNYRYIVRTILSDLNSNSSNYIDTEIELPILVNNSNISD